MLPGERPPHRDAVAKDFRGGGEGAPDGIAVGFVVHEDGVNVAVAGVKDVGGPQLMAAADFRDRFDHLGQRSFVCGRRGAHLQRQ